MVARENGKGKGMAELRQWLEDRVPKETENGTAGGVRTVGVGGRSVFGVFDLKAACETEYQPLASKHIHMRLPLLTLTLIMHAMHISAQATRRGGLQRLRQENSDRC
jgi:hypothetical protein